MKNEWQGELRACADYADRLVDLSDGELADDERQLVKSHIAACAGCQAELARLNASLALLRGAAEQRGAGLQPARHRKRNVAGTYYSAAAICLLLLLAVSIGVFLMLKPGSPPKAAHATPKQGVITASAHDPGFSDSAGPPLLDEAAVLHHIALIEQQARLQASLDLMPKDPWFAEQRAANEELLARYKAATTAAITERGPDANDYDSGDAVPCAGETL